MMNLKYSELFILSVKNNFNIIIEKLLTVGIEVVQLTLLRRLCIRSCSILFTSPLRFSSSSFSKFSSFANLSILARWCNSKASALQRIVCIKLRNRACNYSIHDLFKTEANINMRSNAEVQILHEKGTRAIDIIFPYKEVHYILMKIIFT